MTSITRNEEMAAQCRAFHSRHPMVWVLFQEFTFNRIHIKCEHYSARAIFHRIRWETDQAKTANDEFKLNDHYSPFYARAFMNKYPVHDEFFRTRKQISKDKPATNLPPLGPEDFEET
ncbi:MAG: hypothetical protein O6945_05020 [Gammaproteobacteria bacterium]|nr:hypothetical protein [Gammaproteobacteria bacterium]